METPPSPNIRLTITVTPEVHEAFQQMADVSGMSLGRCMGEWLADTIEGARFLTGQLAKAREAPRQVAAEMRQMLLGGLDGLDQAMADMRSGKQLGADRASAAPHGLTRAAPPRPVIRGGNSSGKTRRAGR